MLYIVAFCVLLIFYIGIIHCMKFMKSTKFWNIIFGSIVFILYISLVLIVFFDVGANDWNFTNTLPVANISPFMFSIIPIVFITPDKIRKYFYLLISLLSVGMFLSTTFNCVYNTVIGYKFHFHFLLDYIAHFILSLWGIYLLKSNQIKINKKNSIISSAIIIGIANLMLVLNLIFDTSFFGLSLRGKHNIYNNVIVESSYLSALIYYVGLLFVLFFGFVFQKLINKKSK